MGRGGGPSPWIRYCLTIASINLQGHPGEFVHQNWRCTSKNPTFSPQFRVYNMLPFKFKLISLKTTLIFTLKSIQYDNLHKLPSRLNYKTNLRSSLID